MLWTASPVFAEPRKLYWANQGNGYESIWRSNLNTTDVEKIISGTNTASATMLGNANCMAIDWKEEYVYFGEGWPNYAIRRISLDGSGFTNLLSGAMIVSGLALDLINRKMYWTHSWGASYNIRRANLDGTDIETLIDTPLGAGIALDLANTNMYWTEGHSITGVIRRATMDGSDAVTLVTGQDAPRGIALDLENEKMYWVTQGNGTGPGWRRALVMKSDLDGSNVETLYDGSVVLIDRPGNIVLHQESQFLYISDNSTYLSVAAVDGSGCSHMFDSAPEASGTWALALYLPAPKGTIFSSR